MLATIIYPFYVNAGVLDVFGWLKSGFGVNKTANKVLSLNTSDTVALKEETLAYPEQTIINMPLSQAVNSPEPTDNKTASNKSIIDGYAFTNENNSLDGSLNTEDNTSSDQISLYTVRKGDTIPAVAKMFGVTPNTIYWANDLKAGAAIKPDQVIIILPITGIKYTVKKGDTVDLLAKKFKSDVGDIVSFNSVDTAVGLTIGQEIIIPNAEVEVVAAKATKTKSGKTPPNSSSKSSSSDTTGYFKRPINGGIKTQGIHGNNGIDLASFGGANIPILAAADGTVIISRSGGWNGGYGNYIVIKHSNGMQTLYGHLSENSVSAGDRVSQGQQIGRMGSTGDSTGVHLHFEVRGGRNPF